jgi:hypothetical protein
MHGAIAVSSALYSSHRVLWMPLALPWRKPSAGQVLCCASMTAALDFACEQHAGPFECPDALVVYNEPLDEYGLVIHDGGPSYLLIANCPWCGAKLPASQRDRWFDAVSALNVDIDDITAIPVKYLSRAWRTEP